MCKIGRIKWKMRRIVDSKGRIMTRKGRKIVIRDLLGLENRVLL
jgi:hypothetical protein